MFLTKAEEIRNLRENRMRKGSKDGVKVKVYTPSVLFKRTFHRGGCYQVIISMHDNLESKYSFKIMYTIIQMF